MSPSSSGGSDTPRWVAGKTAIVTGGGGGIGRALSTALVAAGARVVVADIAEGPAQQVASTLDVRKPGSAVGVGADVTDPDEIAKIIDLAEREFGPVDLYAANAGVLRPGEIDTSAADWDASWQVNVMAQVRAAELLVPGWIEREQGGYFLAVASAAGLLTQIGAVSYSVTKHASVGFAEWLSVTYGDRGVRVGCLCPMGVNTAMLDEENAAQEETADGQNARSAVRSAGNVLEPSDVAGEVLDAIDSGQFLILPHAEVGTMWSQKASDEDRWLRGMRRYRASLTGADA